MKSEKEQFDVIYLLDSEIGINSNRKNSRPCIVIEVNGEDGGLIIPVTSQEKSHNPNVRQHRLAFGSLIDLSGKPIKVTKAQLDYSDLSDEQINNNDMEVLSKFL